MKKRILALFMAAALAVSLSACGGSAGQSEEAAEEVTEEAAEEVAESAVEAAVEEVEEIEEETVPDEPEETGSVEEEAEPEPEIEESEDYGRGAVIDGVYENRTVGIGLVLPEGWEPYSDEQIAEINGMTLEAMGEELGELVEKSGQFYDLMAGKTGTGDNVNIIIEKFEGASRATAEDLKDLLGENKSQIDEVFKNIGIELLDYVIDDEQAFPVDPHAAVRVTGDYQGYQINEIIVVFAVGDFIVNVTASAAEMEDARALIDSFYAVS